MVPRCIYICVTPSGLNSGRGERPAALQLFRARQTLNLHMLLEHIPGQLDGDWHAGNNCARSLRVFRRLPSSRTFSESRARAHLCIGTNLTPAALQILEHSAHLSTEVLLCELSQRVGTGASAGY